MIRPRGTAIVAFHDVTDWHWHHALTREGFQHVLAIWFDTEVERWVTLEYETTGIEIQSFDRDEFDDYVRWLQVERNARFLKVEVKQTVSRFGRIGLWCVPLTAHTIGSPSCAFTPQGLWRDLVREGAVPIFDRRDTKDLLNDEITKTTS